MHHRRRRNLNRLDLTWQCLVCGFTAQSPAKGAEAAIDHVLNDDNLWHGSKYAGGGFLRQLIEARA